MNLNLSMNARGKSWKLLLYTVRFTFAWKAQETSKLMFLAFCEEYNALVNARVEGEE